MGFSMHTCLGIMGHDVSKQHEQWRFIIDVHVAAKVTLLHLSTSVTLVVNSYLTCLRHYTNDKIVSV